MNITMQNHLQGVPDELSDIVNNHPFHSFILLADFIEVLGKCLSSEDWQKSNRSRKDFDNAITTFPSLQKYKNIVDLYGVLRCGLTHAMLPKDGVLLSPDNNDLSSTIGCKELYHDICCAWKDLLSGEVKPAKNLNEEIMFINDDVSGTTQTIIYKNK